MAEIPVESGRWECYYGLLVAPTDTSVIVDDVSSPGVPPCAPRRVHLAMCISLLRKAVESKEFPVSFWFQSKCVAF